MVLGSPNLAVSRNKAWGAAEPMQGTSPFLLHSLDTFLLLKVNQFLVSSAPLSPSSHMNFHRKKVMSHSQHKTSHNILWSRFHLHSESAGVFSVTSKKAALSHTCYTLFLKEGGKYQRGIYENSYSIMVTSEPSEIEFDKFSKTSVQQSI